MATKILGPSREAMIEAYRWIEAGEPFGLPTETVYGLAADVFNSAAIEKVFLAKGRPKYDPLIVHVPGDFLSEIKNTGDLNCLQLCGLLGEMTERQMLKARDLMIAHWPGPLTVILPKSQRVPDLVTSDLSTVALRAPAHPLAQEILRRSNKFLAAPSANRFGKVSPTSAQDVLDELGGRIIGIIDGGKCQVGLESTVVRVDENGQVLTLRPGVITDPSWISVQAMDRSIDRSIESPGQLDRHYQPQTPVIRVCKETWSSLEPLKKAWKTRPDDGTGVALLASTSPLLTEASHRLNEMKIPLIRSHNLVQIPESSKKFPSSELYGLLRELDKDPRCSVIIVFESESHGTECDVDSLRVALSDRVKRASTPSQSIKFT